MCENFLDDLLIFDEADDAHGTPAFGANQRINFINLLNQPCPVFSEGFSDLLICKTLAQLNHVIIPLPVMTISFLDVHFEFLFDNVKISIDKQKPPSYTVSHRKRILIK
jgi:hypothetical protein